MMVARQPAPCGIADHLANNGAQGILNEKIITDVIGRHYRAVACLSAKN
jgi:hypothetical protein